MSYDVKEKTALEVKQELLDKYLSEKTPEYTLAPKIGKRRMKLVHVSSAPLLAQQLYGKATANALFNAKGTYCKKCSK